MSTYTIKRCFDRAEAARGDGDWPRIIREHKAAAKSSDPETARIAQGFALIAERRMNEERWRANAYARLARGEELTEESPFCDVCGRDEGFDVDGMVCRHCYDAADYRLRGLGPTLPCGCGDSQCNDCAGASR